MFSALRQGSLLYILEKGEKPILKIGQVQSVSQPVPKTYTESFVDISVKVGDEVVDFKQLPSTLSIANFNGNMVLAETKELMNAEVEAMVRISNQALDSVDYHKNVIQCCDGILKELNPRYAKEKEREETIASMENRIGGIESNLNDMMAMLSKALKSLKT